MISIERLLEKLSYKIVIRLISFAIFSFGCFLIYLGYFLGGFPNAILVGCTYFVSVAVCFIIYITNRESKLKEELNIVIIVGRFDRNDKLSELKKKQMFVVLKEFFEFLQRCHFDLSLE